MFLVWGYNDALRAQVICTAGCAHGPGLFSVITARKVAKDALLRYALVHRETVSDGHVLLQ